MNFVAADVSPLILHPRILGPLPPAATSPIRFVVPMRDHVGETFHEPAGSGMGVPPGSSATRARRRPHYFSAKVSGPDSSAKVKGPFPEPSSAPPGLGLRQSSGAFTPGPRERKRQRTAAVQDASATGAAPLRFIVPIYA